MELTLADVGLTPSASATLSLEQLERLAHTIDRPPLRPGEPVPLLWHWACFTPSVPTGELGEDGHPRGTSRMLADHPRRMWGSGRVEDLGPLHAGVLTHRRSRIVEVRAVDGSSGSLVTVRLEHLLEQEGHDRRLELQTLVYRGPATAPDRGPNRSRPTPEPPAEGGWRQARVVDEKQLFRFSAVTFNAHRIHYDLAYARRVERYPGLVVHGPLSALLLAEAAAADAARPLHWFEFRARRPLFAGERILLHGRLVDGAGSASVTRPDGAVAMDATYGISS